jgi:hypothetical protein
MLTFMLAKINTKYDGLLSTVYCLLYHGPGPHSAGTGTAQSRMRVPFQALRKPALMNYGSCATGLFPTSGTVALSHLEYNRSLYQASNFPSLSDWLRVADSAVIGAHASLPH